MLGQALTSEIIINVRCQLTAGLHSQTVSLQGVSRPTQTFRATHGVHSAVQNGRAVSALTDGEANGKVFLTLVHRAAGVLLVKLDGDLRAVVKLG